MKSRKEHLQWCKNRANDYITVLDGHGAMSSMISDLRKHPDTAKSVETGFMLMTITNPQDLHAVKLFIDGFN